jgi:MFS family permease
LIFGVSWGLFTLYFASYGLSVSDIGFLKALHPSRWGILQLATGFISDRTGRKVLIYPGMFVQGIGIWLILLANTFNGWITGMSLLGIGSALVYPCIRNYCFHMEQGNEEVMSSVENQVYRDTI